MEAEKLQKNVYVGLQTTYDTPHVCGNCLEHIGFDWSFCPECGCPTGLTADDVKAYLAAKKPDAAGTGQCNRTPPPYFPGDTVYDRFGRAWQVTSSELHSLAAPRWLFRCGHEGTEDYCALYEEEIVSEAQAKVIKQADKERQ